MEAFFRSLIAVFFIGLIVIGIVLFSIFIIVPTGKFVDSRKNATSTQESQSPITSILNSFIPSLVPKGSEEGKSNGNPKTENQVVPREQNPISQPVKPPVPEPAPPTQPYQSAPIKENQIPSTAKKLTISAEGFSPKEFRVEAKQNITLAITSGDDKTHVFKFEDKSLSDVAVGLGPKETRTIAFFTPEKPGSYAFYCDVPGHKARGETGVMIVK